MTENRDCGANAAAYALGALEPAEAEAFRRHMETCSVCQDEVAAFQQAADALAMGVPQHPAPRALQRRVMRAVRAETRPARPKPSRTPPGPRVWFGRPALAGGLALLAAIAVAIGVTLSGGGGPAATRTIQASVRGLPGTAQLRLSGSRAELVVTHLPAPPTGDVYEVWLKRPSRPARPAGVLFSVTSGGRAQVAVPGSLAGVNAVLVTPEPDGGSPRPTHSPVIVASL